MGKQEIFQQMSDLREILSVSHGATNDYDIAVIVVEAGEEEYDTELVDYCQLLLGVSQMDGFNQVWHTEDNSSEN